MVSHASPHVILEMATLTLCLLRILSCFFSCFFFFFCRQLITFADSFDPDHERRSSSGF